MSSHHSLDPKTTTWLTPPWLLAHLGEFDLDPCTPEFMPWPTARNRYTEKDDGLSQKWEGRVWMNPPYTSKEIKKWLKKMADHKNGIALIFARTETSAFFDYVWDRATSLFFIKGRLYFHNSHGHRAKENSGAPSVLIAYGDYNDYVLRNLIVEGKYMRNR